MKTLVLGSVALSCTIASVCLCAWTHHDTVRLGFERDVHARKIHEWKVADEWRAEQKRKKALAEAAEEEKRAKLHAERQAKKEAVE